MSKHGSATVGTGPLSSGVHSGGKIKHPMGDPSEGVSQFGKNGKIAAQSGKK